MKHIVIPTLKREDYSRHCCWHNVVCCSILSDERPHDELLRASYNFFVHEAGLYKGKWECEVSLERIHSQHHYCGDKLRFVENYNIGITGNSYILSNVCGAIFLQLANGTISYDEAVVAAEEKTTHDYKGNIV